MGRIVVMLAAAWMPGVYGDVGAGVRRAELLGEEPGDGLCTARGTEEIQVQIVRLHGMTSRCVVFVFV